RRTNQNGRVAKLHPNDTDGFHVECACFHEAGHALLGFWYWSPLISVEVRSDGTGLTKRSVDALLDRPLDVSFDAVTRTLLERDVMFCLAGDIAEWRHAGGAHRFDASDDFVDACD